MIVETTNLRLIPCDAEILKSAIEGNEPLAKKINATVKDGWTEFGVDALQYSLDRLSRSEEEKNWWTFLPVLKEGNELIGSGGYKGRPIRGMVELGYEIAPAHRNRGLATEMTKGLVENAFKDSRVKSVIAHTLAEENASTKVLFKCDFQLVEEIFDPKEGLIWKWELTRNT